MAAVGPLEVKVDGRSTVHVKEDREVTEKGVSKA